MLDKTRLQEIEDQYFIDLANKRMAEPYETLSHDEVWVD